LDLVRFLFILLYSEPRRGCFFLLGKKVQPGSHASCCVVPKQKESSRGAEVSFLRGTLPASRPSVPLLRRPPPPDEVPHDPNCQPLPSFSSVHRAPTRTACSSLLAHLRHSSLRRRSPPKSRWRPSSAPGHRSAGKLILLSPCSLYGQGFSCFACSLARPVFDGITVRARFTGAEAGNKDQGGQSAKYSYKGGQS
jgi:hypothetical protein